jgi:transposase
MTYYAGLDVSLEQTSVCVVDEAGVVVLERRVATEPAAIAAALAALPQAPARVLLETGGLTPWLWHELGGRGLVVHCIDARRAKAQLALRPAKTDRNDARGLAEIARMGWYANIRVKSLDHQALRAKLAARAQLVTIARDLGNQLRGLLRTFGLRVGKGKGQAFEQRVLALVADCAALQPVADGLLAARRAVLAEVERLDRVLLRDARADATCQRLMTASLAPSADVVSARSAKGVGAITAPGIIRARSRRRAGFGGPARSAPMWGWCHDATSRARSTARGGSRSRATRSSAATCTRRRPCC